jgi:hypothetical protein
MPVPFIPNCCGRLHSILIRVEPVRQQAFGVILSDIFAVQPDDTSSILSKFGTLVSLTDESRSTIEKHLEHPEMYTVGLKDLRATYPKLRLDQHAGEFISALSPANLASLWHAARMLQLKGIAELDPSGQEAVELQREVMELVQRIQQGPLPTETKSLLIEMLTIVHRSLSEYALTGPKRIKEIVENSIGVMYLNQDLFEPPEAKAQANEVLRTLSRVGKAASDMTKVVVVLDSARKFLGI